MPLLDLSLSLKSIPLNAPFDIYVLLWRYSYFLFPTDPLLEFLELDFEALDSFREDYFYLTGVLTAKHSEFLLGKNSFKLSEF